MLIVIEKCRNKIKICEKSLPLLCTVMGVSKHTLNLIMKLATKHYRGGSMVYIYIYIYIDR
jgi:hypothetical protein